MNEAKEKVLLNEFYQNLKARGGEFKSGAKKPELKIVFTHPNHYESWIMSILELMER